MIEVERVYRETHKHTTIPEAKGRLESLIDIFNICKAHDNALVAVSIGKEDVQAFTQATKALEQQEKTGWVPVSERLPEEHTCDDGLIEPSEYVLIQMRSGCMKVSRYWGSRERYKDCPWIDMRYPTTDEVIAWMPLPEPYKGVSE